MLVSLLKVPLSLLSLLLVLYSVSSVNAEVWYISSDGSSDVASCGRNVTNPCASLRLVLDQVGTTLQGQCYEPIDGTQDITFFFLGGRIQLDPRPTCFMGWSGLTITAEDTVTIDSSLPNSRGVLEIFDSTDITVSNVRFLASLVGKATLYVSNSSNIVIEKCVFPVYATASNGILLVNVFDTVNITDTIFNTIPILVQRFNLQPSAALIVDQGYLGYGIELGADESPFDPCFLTVRNCSFNGLLSGGTGFENSASNGNDYVVTSTISQAVLVQFGRSGNDNDLVFRDCFFQSVTSLRGSVALIRHSSDTSGNMALFDSCRFEGNTARYGAGVAAYFIEQSHDNHVIVRNSVFSRNKALFEGGGVFVASIVGDPTNTVVIDKCSFNNTSSLYGAGLFVLNDPNWYSNPTFYSLLAPPLINVTVVDCQFVKCNASVSEGVVNVFDAVLNISGDNVFTGNNGSAVVLRSSVLVAIGNLSFTHNKAESGGALKILDGSSIDFTGSNQVLFSFNQARFAGGALYADASSTTVTADVYDHTVASGVTGSCFVQFPFSEESQLYFSNNTALTSGNDFHIYNIRSCQQGYFLPNPLQIFVPTAIANRIVIATQTPLLTTSTGPSFLYFYGSSSQCYKPVGDLVYRLPNCSHELLTDSFYGLTELMCGVNAMVDEFAPFQGPGGGLHPTVDKLLLPWAGIDLEWTMEPQSRRSNCFEPSPGSLTLSPAPGELFDLTVQLADQLLNFITGTVYMEVDHQPEVPPGVLLQLNGIQYAYTDRIYFTPNRALSGLAIIGLPGTSGNLNIVSVSQIEGKDIILQLPFVLSHCPVGYFDPPGVNNIDEVNTLITTIYSTTQRIPSHSQPLSCQCFTSSNITYFDLPNFYRFECVGGYTVELSGALWAGLIPMNATPVGSLSPVTCWSPSNVSTLIQDPLTSWIKAERMQQLQYLGTTEDPNVNPVDVIPYKGLIVPGGGAPVECFANYSVRELVGFERDGEFSVDYCLRGFCRGNSESRWYLSDVDYPCVTNREGVLCGQCKPHLSQTVTSTVCKDCSNPRWYIPLLTTLIGGLILVIFVTLLNIGVTPTLDSLLFFIQSAYIVVNGRTGYSSYTVTLAVFNLDFTFDQCITSDLGALTRLLLQYMTPLYLMLLLVATLALTKVKGFSRYLGNHSILQAVWLLILISYLNIANSTFEIVHCHFIGPAKGGGTSKYVLVYDASIQCWSGSHLPWAILAIALVVFFIIPFPLYVLFAKQSPKLKPIADVYCSVYRDSQRSWVMWNLLRRTLVVILSVFVVNEVYRHFSLLTGFLLVLAIFTVTRPYQYSLDNLYGGFVSFCIVFFSIVTEPTSYEYFDPYRIVSWTIVAVVLTVGVVLLTLESVLRYLKHRGYSYTKDDVVSDLKERALRLRAACIRVGSKGKESIQFSVSSDAGRARRTYSQYREPLIDSECYLPGVLSSSTSQRRRSSESELSSSENVKAINHTSTVVSITDSLV